MAVASPSGRDSVCRAWNADADGVERSRPALEHLAVPHFEVDQTPKKIDVAAVAAAPRFEKSLGRDPLQVRPLKRLRLEEHLDVAAEPGGVLEPRRERH